MRWPRRLSPKTVVPMVVTAVVVMAGVVTLGTGVVGPSSAVRSTDATGHRSAPATGAARTTASPRAEATTTTDIGDINDTGGLPALDPTTSSPLRVLEIGDSLGIDLGIQLQNQLDGTGVAVTTMAAQGDTGLANLAYYDWPAQLATLLTADRPQIVVVFLGANDDQGLSVEGTAVGPGTAAWDRAYGARVAEVLDEAAGAGARVVWVGMPPMDNAALNAAMDVENAIFEDQSTRVRGSLYVSATTVLGTPAGRYQSDGVGPGGVIETWRTPDGVHLTPDGADVLATVVIDTIDRHFDLALAGAVVPTGPGRLRRTE